MMELVESLSMVYEVLGSSFNTVNHYGGRIITIALGRRGFRMVRSSQSSLATLGI